MQIEQNIAKNHQLDFVAHLSAQIAEFFNEVTETCIKELSQLIQHRQTASLQPQPPPMLPPKDIPPSSLRVQNSKKKGRPKAKGLVSHKPKAPTSSYLLFFHENKTTIAAKLGVTSVADITRAASQEWKKLGEQQKIKYQRKSQEQQVRYHEAMKIYKQQYAEQILLHKELKRQLAGKGRKEESPQPQKQKLPDVINLESSTPSEDSLGMV